ncbi:MAG: methyltransferase domain-containing protein [Nitrospinae bacterium]|nr:methyltransferase domain-containing protein [Nitrospinota bacterium]
MIRSLNLDQLGSQIELIDEFTLVIAAHRMELSLNVGAFKKSQNPPTPIFNKERENGRLEKVMKIAEELGLNPNFAASMLYNIIGESCKQQMIQLQGNYDPLPDTKDDDEWFGILKNNLRSMTEKISPTYDSEYDKGLFGLKQYKAFENSIIDTGINIRGQEDLAIDLGCATGPKTFHLAKRFKRVIGYDICQHMIRVANAKIDSKDSERITFRQVDLEDGIPLPDDSVSYVVMNLGIASDIINIEKLIQEVRRTLVPGGGFLFSFYNLDALIYKWEFLPWPLTVAAKIN